MKDSQTGIFSLVPDNSQKRRSSNNKIWQKLHNLLHRRIEDFQTGRFSLILDNPQQRRIEDSQVGRFSLKLDNPRREWRRYSNKKIFLKTG